MRACKVLILAALVLAVGAVQASSARTTLRISMTVLERCDIRAADAVPSVDCSAGIPWALATPATAAIPPSALVQTGGTSHATHLPVPHSDADDGSRVTTVVF
ncbi:hypothetical protein CSC62_05690 [Pseudoxanthomonas jiangsuensis]|uniref:hypothetical protein n=1 Tax=Pseudoxanthomonas jiangsuensis TaxID=619688 RepID=UPI001391600D|nr:hypothetical protein [Pseudoxanthomonas jiangsuensis]KAF1698399.1 hypothetical protein CSC62_05690 [Pseudoxanthomonas jiangsuensis]